MASSSFFRFCPRCAAPLKNKLIDGRPVLTCTRESCGFEFFQDSKPVGAGLVLNTKGEVLLVKRARDPHKGHWQLPGGFLHLGELPDKGAQREILEETGIRADIVRYLGTYIDPYPHHGVKLFTQVTFFVMHATSGTLHADPAENVDARWWNIRKLPHIAFSSNRHAMRDYLKPQ